MIITSKIKNLIPTQAYGNLEIWAEVTVDTAKDMARLEAEAKDRKLDTRASSLSTETVQSVVAQLAKEQIDLLKHEIDQLTKEDFKVHA